MQKTFPLIIVSIAVVLLSNSGCSGPIHQVEATDFPGPPSSDEADNKAGQLDPTPAPGDQEQVKAATQPNLTLKAQPMTTELLEYKFSSIGLGIYRESVKEGIKVTYVSPNSGAETAGIKPGDVFTSIDGNNLTTLEQAEIDGLLAGEVGQTRLLETNKKKIIEVTIGTFAMKDIGAIRKFDAQAFATPSIDGIHSALKPVVQLIIDRKYRAAEQILASLAGTEATNGSFYLARALQQAASHGMLSSDSRVVDPSSGQTPTNQILEDVELAVEMDESLRDVAAELLAWLSTSILLDAADKKVDLTWVTPADYQRWNLDREKRYRSIGDWIQLLNKAENLNSDVIPRYLAAIKVSRDRYLQNLNVRSAAFLDGVLAYRCCIADDSNVQMQREEVLAVNSSSLRLLTRFLQQHPDRALEVAAVFNSMCAEDTSSVARPGEPDFDQFWERLRQTDKAAANFALRYYLPHEPPQFNRLATPMEAYLFHIESLFTDNLTGLKASTEKEVYDSLKNPQEVLGASDNNAFLQSMLQMQAVAAGLIPEYVTNAAQHSPFVVENSNGVSFHLITMKLYDVHFKQDVPAMVPMMAQGIFPQLRGLIQQIAPEPERQKVLDRATEAGRDEDLVIGVVYETSRGQYQVMRSPVINFFSMGE